MKDVIHYTKMPSVAVFQRDSSVALAIRSNDKIIVHLDWLLDRYQFAMAKNDNSKRCVVLCDIFVTANFWIKCYHQKHPAMKQQRYPAVLGLFERAKYELSFAFVCREAEVGRRITEVFGRDLTPEGAQTDRASNAAYYDKLQLQQYRLRFRAGRVYQLRGGNRNGSMQFVPVNSKEFYEYVRVRDTENNQTAERMEGWGPFAMTLEREFYMSKHTARETPGIFHSAYTRGGTLSAAGTMFIENGQILGLRGDSGHYKPIENNMAMVITALGMYSVPLMPIKVYDWTGTFKGTALDFVRSRLTWDAFVAAGKDYRDRKHGVRPLQANQAAPLPPSAPSPPPAPLPLPQAEHEEAYQN
jgi:hypothetical protein